MLVDNVCTIQVLFVTKPCMGAEANVDWYGEILPSLFFPSPPLRSRPLLSFILPFPALPSLLSPSLPPSLPFPLEVGPLKSS